jgi:tetratricopeptide (TPR) repeat protein
MKKTLIALAVILSSIVTQAQVLAPQPSPKSTINQIVGLTDVEIEYSRPSARGRNVFGELVSFGKVWRTGANSNTTISFSEDVVINGKTLKKGKYALYTLPKVESWEIIFYSKTDNWGNPEVWNEGDVALRAIAIPEVLNKNAETFTIDISNLDNNFAYLNLSWEKTLVSLKFDVPTQKAAIASIEKALAGPTAGDYFSAAQYYYQSNGDISKALTFVNKAIELNKQNPFWYTKLKSLIQAKLGDKNGAIDTAKLSLAAAKVAKNDDYIKMNEDNILEWSKK